MAAKFEIIVNALRTEASKSTMNNKHACVAICKGKIVSPKFHNYMRSYMHSFNCGSLHAEMAVINYLLNLGSLRDGKVKQYILSTVEQHTGT